uniref:Uncharacterized protein n=1 Tax=Micrurus lemniscatus lemniscatus TaxID=129467 RepID=A0A2D4J3I2_MICLE
MNEMNPFTLDYPLMTQIIRLKTLHKIIPMQSQQYISQVADQIFYTLSRTAIHSKVFSAKDAFVFYPRVLSNLLTELLEPILLLEVVKGADANAKEALKLLQFDSSYFSGSKGPEGRVPLMMWKPRRLQKSMYS